jgi:hypothetical protein
MTAHMHEAIAAIGRQLSAAYTPIVLEPLPSRLKELVDQLVASEMLEARIERETTVLCDLL